MKPMVEAIIKASIGVLNEKGIYRFSMREIAKKLNIRASALYNHVKGRKEIYSLLTEYICDELKFSPVKIRNAKLFLTESNKQLRLELLKIRDSAVIFGETVPDTPKHLEFIKKTMEALLQLGLKGEYCFFAANTLINYVLLFVMDEEYFKSIPRKKPQSPGTEFYRQQIAGTNYDRQFLYGLEVIIAGLQKNR